MQRRQLLKLAGAALLASNLGYAKARSQRVLILGGTGFIGPHFVDALKGRRLHGYGYVLVNGTMPRRKIEAANVAEAVEWFGEMGGNDSGRGVRRRACGAGADSDV